MSEVFGGQNPSIAEFSAVPPTRAQQFKSRGSYRLNIPSADTSQYLGISVLFAHVCMWGGVVVFFLRWLCGIVIEDEQIQKSAWTALKAA